MSKDSRYRDINKLAADISSAIEKSSVDSNIGINVSHNWGDQTTEQAGAGLFWFDNLKRLAYSNKLKFYGLSPVRNVPVRVATFGDSTANVGPTIHDTSIIEGIFPASGINSVSVNQTKWALSNYYPMAYLVANCGISGDTTQNMLARDNLIASASRKAIIDALNLAPDIVILRGGSINDIASLTPEQLVAKIPITYANHISIIERFTSAGITVIDEGIFGYAVPGAYLKDIQKTIVTLNDMFSEYAKNSNGKVIFLSTEGKLSIAGKYIEEISTDNIHLSSKGSEILAKMEADLFTLLFGESAQVRYKGTNRLTNFLFVKNTTTAQGIIADDLVVTGSNATITEGRLETYKGKIYNTFLVTPSASANSCMIKYQLPVTSGIVVNDIFGIELDFMVVDADGGPPPVQSAGLCRVSLFRSDATRFIYAFMAPSFPGKSSDSTGFFGRATGNPLKIAEESANLTSASVIEFQFGTDSLLPYRIGIAAPRFVKLDSTTYSSI